MEHIGYGLFRPKVRNLQPHFNPIRLAGYLFPTNAHSLSLRRASEAHIPTDLPCMGDKRNPRGGSGKKNTCGGCGGDEHNGPCKL